MELSHYSNQICDVCNKGLPWMALGSKPVQCKREEGGEEVIVRVWVRVMEWGLI